LSVNESFIYLLNYHPLPIKHSRTPMSRRDLLFTEDELRLIGDKQFFLQKARIMKKVRALLDDLYTALQSDVARVNLLAPPSFNFEKYQFVKGEHLEDYPYQYLDFPKHFEGDEKFTFRSLFWWGHHFAFAMILEGRTLLQCKQNLINRYHQVAGKDIHLSLSASPWEWKRGEGYTLPVTHDRKSEVAAVLGGRRFFKLCRFVRHDDAVVTGGRLVQTGRETFQSILPVITP
jgi:hypothetical protein